ncbi:MAG: MMPL family transporter, partial [Planctomycetota bacterium]
MARPSQVLASAAGRWPWTILLLSIAAAVASGFCALHLLKLDTNRDLVEHSPEYQARKDEYSRQFDSPAYTIAIFSAPDDERTVSPETRRELKAASREFAAWARSQPKALFETITERVDPSEFGDLGLLYMDLDDLASLSDRLEASRPILSRVAADPGLAGVLAAVNDGWDELTTRASSSHGSPSGPSDPPAAPPIGELLGVVEACVAAAEGRDAAGPHVETLLLGGEGDGDVDPQGFLFRGGGRYALVLLDVNEDDTALNQIEGSLNIVREGVRQTLAAHPRLRGGVTGEPVLEAEEMDASVTDFGRSTVVTFAAVALMLLVSFRRFVRPLLALGPLLLAIVWTLGATALVLGKMNLLAMVFAIILIAMGIDYGIILVAHYERGLRSGLASVPALEGAFKSAGTGLLAGCLASVAVFLSAAFTQYRGFAELGIISAMGLSLCLLAMTTTLPALLVLVDRRRRPEAVAEPSDPPAPPRAPRLQGLLAAVLVLLGGVGVWMGRPGWDFSLLELLPEGLDSVRWLMLLVEEDRPPVHAVALARDRAELDSLVERFRAVPAVRDVETVFPRDEQAKRDLLARLRGWVGGLDVGVPKTFDVDRLRREAMRFRTNLRDAADRSKEARQELAPLIQALGRLVEALRARDPEAATRLARLEDQVSRSLVDGLGTLRRMADPGPVSSERVPAILRQDFVGSEGLLAVRVYPRENTWTWPALPNFVAAVQEVDPDVIGDAVSLHQCSVAIEESFRVSVGVALAAVVLLLVATFRRPLPVLVGLVPMGVSLALLAGVMSLTGRGLNFANYFAVPVLLGAGIEYDIHLVQSFRLGAGERLLRSTRWAILLCALSTLIGFASLVPARHRGVASLGWV